MPFMAALPAIMAGAGLLGKLFGGAAKGSANQRMAENQQAQNAAIANNQMALQAALARNNDTLSRADLDLRQRGFQQQETGSNARRAIAGSMLQRIQPLQLSGLSDRAQRSMPTMNNSILSALGPEARQAGALLASKSVNGLKNPTQFSALPALQIPAMQQAQMKGSGLLEKILGAGGLIGSTVGAMGDLTTLGGGNGRPYEPNDENGWG